MKLEDHLRELDAACCVILADREGAVVFACDTADKQFRLLDLYADASVIEWKPISDKALYFKLDTEAEKRAKQ